MNFRNSTWFVGLFAGATFSLVVLPASPSSACCDDPLGRLLTGDFKSQDDEESSPFARAGKGRKSGGGSGLGSGPSKGIGGGRKSESLYYKPKGGSNESHHQKPRASSNESHHQPKGSGKGESHHHKPITSQDGANIFVNLIEKSLERERGEEAANVFINLIERSLERERQEETSQPPPQDPPVVVQSEPPPEPVVEPPPEPPVKTRKPFIPPVIVKPVEQPPVPPQPPPPPPDDARRRQLIEEKLRQAKQQQAQGENHQHGDKPTGIDDVRLIKGAVLNGRRDDYLIVKHRDGKPIVVSVGDTYDKTYEGKQKAEQLLTEKGLNKAEVRDVLARRQEIIDRLNTKLNDVQSRSTQQPRPTLNQEVKQAFDNIEKKNDLLRDAGVSLDAAGELPDHNLKTQDTINRVR